MLKNNLFTAAKALTAATLTSLGLITGMSAHMDCHNISGTITAYAMEHQIYTDSLGYTLSLDYDTWHCYNPDGLIDYNYDGLVLNDYGWWKVSNGTVDFSFNGIAVNEYGWWKVTDGAVDFSFNGLAQNEYGWWKITDGAVDFSFNGLAQNEAGWWKITDGAVDFSFNGLAQNEAGWWKITDGAVDFSFNGLASNEYGWWYLADGAVDFSYNGMAANEYGWWEITNGAVDFNFYGISTNIYGSWKIAGGTVDWGYNGEYNCNGILYNVSNGHIEDVILSDIIVDADLTPVIIVPEPDIPTPLPELDIPSNEPEPDIPSNEPEEIPSEEESSESITYKQLDVPAILQNPELPAGCEITSLAIVLNYYGYDIDKCDLSDYYLDKGEIGVTNPNVAFVGEPRIRGSYGCYAPVIVNCANSYLNGDRQVINITGTPFYDLLDYINNGIPVIIWATSGMCDTYYSVTWNLPDGDFTWKAHEHCVVITGYDYDNELIFVADSIADNTEYDMDTIADKYAQMGYQAVVII